MPRLLSKSSGVLEEGGGVCLIVRVTGDGGLGSKVGAGNKRQKGPLPLPPLKEKRGMDRCTDE